MVITKDALAGVMFIVFGAAAVFIARDYSFGTASRMGPGYFPVVIGGLVALLGLVQLVGALRRPESSESVKQWEIRPLFFLLVAVLIFAVVMRSFGLIPAVVTLVLTGRLAAREGSLVELAVMVVVLTVISVGVFVYGLNMPLKLGPW